MPSRPDPNLDHGKQGDAARDAKGYWGGWMKHFWVVQFQNKWTPNGLCQNCISSPIQHVSLQESETVSNSENGFFFNQPTSSDRRPSSLKMCLSHLQLLLQTFYQGNGIHFMPVRVLLVAKTLAFETLPSVKMASKIAKNSENQFDMATIPNEASKLMQFFPAFFTISPVCQRLFHQQQGTDPPLVGPSITNPTPALTQSCDLAAPSKLHVQHVGHEHQWMAAPCSVAQMLLATGRASPQQKWGESNKFQATKPEKLTGSTSSTCIFSFHHILWGVFLDVRKVDVQKLLVYRLQVLKQSTFVNWKFRPTPRIFKNLHEHY